MKLMKNIEGKLFLIIAFWLGTWGAVFNVTQSVFIGIGLLYNIIKFREDFFVNLKRYKYYIGISVFFLFYLGVHTLIVMTGGKYDYKPSFGTFEAIPFFFLLGALYVMSVRSFITVSLLKNFLIVFCLSVFTFNVYTLFYLGGTALFSEPLNVISNIYAGRFGGTKEFLGGQVYLDAHALQLGAASLFMYFLFFVERLKKVRILWFSLFLCLVWFLSLTVTKSSILSFLCGFFLFNFYLFRKFSTRNKKKLLVSFVFAATVIYFCLPSAFEQRMLQVREEYVDVKEGDLQEGGTITPRVVFYKECFRHFDQYALWGLGVYTNPVSKQWYLNSGNVVVASLSHSHNSYLQYWMIGGVVGLLFILSWFILPVYQMFREHCFSYLSLSVILLFFVDNNAEVMLIISDSTPVIIFFLAMFYFYNDKFVRMEIER